jgi:hypothetical protein
MSNEDLDSDEAFLSGEVTQPEFDGRKLRPFSAGTSSLLIKIASPILCGGTPTHLDVAAFILIHLDDPIGQRARVNAFSNPDTFAAQAIEFADSIEDGTTKLQEFIPVVLRMFEQSDHARTVAAQAKSGKAQKKTKRSGARRGSR